MRDDIAKLVNEPHGFIHLMGIGGVGMAGLAVQLQHRGFQVSGCDVSGGGLSDWLKQHGIAVAKGHDPSHLGSDVAAVIHSAAVSFNEPELKEAQRRGIPTFSRGEVLPALFQGKCSVAVAGSHGKTTTTAMIAHILKYAGRDISFCVGGFADALGGVAAVGDDPVFVVEADESDGTLALYEPDYAVITNIDYDHHDFFKTKGELVRCFESFARNAKKKIIYCEEDVETKRLLQNVPNKISYGFSKMADVRTELLLGGPHSVVATDATERVPPGIYMKVSGRHNLLNASAACAVCLELGIAVEKIYEALGTFVSVRRRFETIADDKGITVISDYAHHPTEIRCLIQQAQGLKPKRIITVFQPHSYSRTAALGSDFPEAFRGVEKLILTPVYAASEKPVEGGRGEDLYRHFRDDRSVSYAVSLEEAWQQAKQNLVEGDLLLVVGAGDVEKVAFWAKDYLQSM